MPGETTTVVDEFGRLVDIPTELVGSFQGRRADPVELARRQHEQQLASDPLLALGAGAAGALRGLTLGGSDPLLAAASGVGYREGADALQGLREVAPVASGVGELVGAAAPVLASGGSALALSPAAMAARAGAAAGRSVLGRAGAGVGGRLLAGAATGAVEGGIYGLGAGVSEEMLRAELDRDPTGAATRVLMSVGLNALMGGALGGAGAGLEEAATAARRSLPEAAGLSGYAQRMAAESAAGNYAKGHDALMIRGAEAGGGNRIGARLLEEQGLTLSDPAAVAKLAKIRKREAGAAIDEALREAGKDAVVDGSAILSRGRQLVTELRARGSTVGDNAARTLEREVTRLEKRLAPPPGVVRGRGAAAQPVAPRPLTAEEAHVMQSDLGKLVFEKRKPGAPMSATETALADYQSAIQSELETVISATPGPAAAKWQASRQAYGDWAEIEKAAGFHARARSKNRDISLTDYLAGIGGSVAGLASGNILPVVGGLAFGQVNKLVRERGSAGLARIAHAMSKSDERIWTAAKRIAGTLGPVAQRAPAAARAATFRGVDAYQRASELPKEARDRPAQYQARLAAAVQPLAETHPELAAQVSVQTMRAMDALARRLPRSRTASVTLTPNATEPVLSPEDEARYVAVANAIENPDGTLEDIASGTADWDQVRALREAYPELWQELRERIATEAQTATEELPFERRIAVGLAWDLPTDVSLTPGYMAAMQAAHARAAQAAAPPQTPRPASASQSRNTYGQFATRGDKLESGT